MNTRFVSYEAVRHTDQECHDQMIIWKWIFKMLFHPAEVFEFDGIW